MKIRIKFSKHGNICYIGHLDIMRYFQKAFRRSDIPIKYSEGFSPHQIMSFAAPLGLGIESDAEYMDIEITEAVDPEEAKARLNKEMCDGIEILSWRELPDNAKNAMSQVTAADYLIKNADFDVDSFLSKEEVIIEKINKKGETIKKDIRPLVYEMKKTEDGIFIKVAQGSENNLKPEDVIKGGTVIRKELYGPDLLTL